jgi:hypothetical protein
VSVLSREARAIIVKGKSKLVPTEADRARVTQLLNSRMGAEGLRLSVPTSPAAVVVAGKALKLLTLASVLSVIGTFSAVAYFGRQSAQLPTPAEKAIVVEPSPMQAPSAQPQLTAEAPKSAAPPAISSNTNKSEPSQYTAKSSRDSLGQEVQILSRAERELHNGRPELALKALDEHQRRFASGALVQERSAARVQALCALGRTQEAKVESIKLKRSSPNSPQAAQMSSPCESTR